MNLLHLLSEPLWLTVLIIAALAIIVWSILLFVFVNAKTKPELPYVEIDELQRAIERRNAHCRIKAEYDCHG